jgi:AraC-like DNA-binding protein
MKNPIVLHFSSPVISRNPVSQKLPEDCRYPVSYANAELIRLEGGTLLRQYYSHYLFYIELYEFNLSDELSLSYQVEEPTLFLFFMMEGSIRFSTPDGNPITEADKGICYATFNRPGEYIGHLLPGIHHVFYISPRTEWLKTHIEQYPKLKEFVFDLDNGNSLYGHMPRCLITGPIYRTLLQLYELNDNKVTDIETELLRFFKQLLGQYDELVSIKLKQPVYRIRHFLEEYYMDSKLSNQVLTRSFYITEKTLTKNFRKEFGMSPYAWLTRLRMQKARQLLAKDKLHINEVFEKVGYKDSHSFSAQFRKFFGYPPSAAR